MSYIVMIQDVVGLLVHGTHLFRPGKAQSILVSVLILQRLRYPIFLASQPFTCPSLLGGSRQPTRCRERLHLDV